MVYFTIVGIRKNNFLLSTNIQQENLSLFNKEFATQ